MHNPGSTNTTELVTAYVRFAVAGRRSRWLTRFRPVDTVGVKRDWSDTKSPSAWRNSCSFLAIVDRGYRVSFADYERFSNASPKIWKPWKIFHHGNVQFNELLPRTCPAEPAIAWICLAESLHELTGNIQLEAEQLTTKFFSKQKNNPLL